MEFGACLLKYLQNGTDATFPKDILYIYRLIIKLILSISCALILYNECLVYYLNQLRWNQLYCETDNCTRILFVADPQLLGKEFDKAFYSSFAIYDSDKFLKSTFQRGLSFTQPDIICFLGDLLDEGSVASPHQFTTYVRRFEHIYDTNDKIRKVHLPGDNDIGGENGEYISNSNVRRFEIEFMHEDLFDYENRIRFFKINRMLLDYVNPDRENNVDRTRIGLSHMPILNAGGPLLRGVLSDLDPHVIFSAHWHESRIFYYPSSQVIHFYDNKIETFDLDALKNAHTYLEIMVPTSSYRMGTPNIGFGFATLENNILRYTVLWNSSRFIYLKIYLVWIVTIIALLLSLKIMVRCPVRFSARQHHFNRISIVP